MKRILSLTVTLILVMSMLTSCIVIPLRKRFKIDESRVESIEIYDFCQYTDQYQSVTKTILEDDTPAYVIPDESVGKFLTDLGKIRFKDYFVITIAAVDPSFAYDTWTVRINYTDGSYQFLSSGGYGQSFDANGEQTDSHHYSADDEEWEELIGKYLPEELFEHQH